MQRGRSAQKRFSTLFGNLSNCFNQLINIFNQTAKVCRKAFASLSPTLLTCVCVGETEAQEGCWSPVGTEAREPGFRLGLRPSFHFLPKRCMQRSSHEKEQEALLSVELLLLNSLGP